MMLFNFPNRSRFHDGKGNLVNWIGLAHAPRAFFSAVVSKVTGYRPLLPWLPYQLISRLKKEIKPNWKILEFGSGMSTLWFAQQTEFVYSIESDQKWYEKIKKTLEKKKYNHVQYEYKSKEEYSIVQCEDQFFDLVIVDGILRDQCTQTALKKVKPGGYILIDNTDCDMRPPQGEMRVTEKTIIEAALNRRGRIDYFIDFSPTQFFVHQALLAKLPT